LSRFSIASSPFPSRQPRASRHPDATLVNGGTNLFASLDTAIRQGLTELAFVFQQMKKTKAELALFVQKSPPELAFLQGGQASRPLPSNKTAAHA
jgi:hypothetical protein